MYLPSSTKKVGAMIRIVQVLASTLTTIGLDIILYNTLLATKLKMS